MNAKSLLILAGATAVVAIGAAVTLHSRESAVHAVGQDQKLFPALMSSINDVAMIRVQRKDGAYTLKRDGDRWVLVEKGNYPVDIAPVRKTLIELSGLTTLEAKTTDSARYDKLGVQDVDAEGSTSTLLTLADASGKELAKLIVGKQHQGKGMGGGEIFVRKSGDNQSWLAKGDLEVKEKSADWLDKQILEVKRDRIRSVEITHPDGEVVHVERQKPEENDFVLSNIPEGKELKYPTVAGALSSALDFLNLEDVVPASEVDFKTNPGAVSRFMTFDGLVITVTTKDDKDKTYARFEASYEAPPPEAAAPAATEDKQDDANAKDAEKTKHAKKTPEEEQKEIADINARTGPWTYVIPTYNKASFTKHISDLLKDKAPPAPPPGSQPPADGADASDGENKDSYMIPSDLPPEIQEQIKQHQESLGHKTMPGPAKTPEVSPKGSETPAKEPPHEAPPEAPPPAQEPPRQ